MCLKKLHLFERPFVKRLRPISLDRCLSCAVQIVGWIKIPLGVEVGLGPGHIVLDGDPAPPKRGIAPIFRPMPIEAK